MSEGNGLILTNGRAPKNKRGDLVYRGDVDKMIAEAVQAERVENEQMVKWYMMQIPELVAKMLGDALAANGLVMQGPQGAGHTADESAPASDAQHAGQTDGGDAAAPESDG